MRVTTISPTVGYRPLSSVDGALSILDRAARGSAPGLNSPPYNVIAVDEGHFRIVLSVPGFKETDLDIVSEPNRLTVSGAGQAATEGEVVYRGILQQPFKRTFELADHVRAEGARLENGLLTIELVREVPEALKPRRIQVTGAGQSATDAAHGAGETKSR